MKRYLFFVSVSYAYSILRPLQDEIRRRGDDVAWYFESPCDQYLRPEEKQLKTIREVMEYNPIAVFVPGNHVYDFFPGIKVELFHGLLPNKRPDNDSHFRIRGWFDLYCTRGEMSTPRYKELEKKYGFFKVVETGWCKLDACVPLPVSAKKEDIPTILYASTFSPKITSTPFLYEELEKLIQKKGWKWLITFHPKMDTGILERYKQLEKYANVTYCETDDNVELLRKADVLLCDTSSIIQEFLWFDKPAVTFRNTCPGDYLIDVNEPEQIEAAIEKALTRPDELMQNIRAYMNKLHPYRDGKSSARVLDAVDDFIANYKGKLRSKPLNLWRRLKIRWQAHYFPFGPHYRKKKF